MKTLRFAPVLVSLGLFVASLLMVPRLASGQAELINANLVVAGHTNSCFDTGTVNTYSCTLDRTLTQYELRACYQFLANSTNTGPATVNFSSVGGSPMGAKSIVKMPGGVTTALSANDIRAGQIVVVCYDGTNMQMLSQLGNLPAIFSDSAGLAGLLSDETGSGGGGLAVFNQSPTLVTPTIGSFANATHTHTTAAGGGQLTDAALSAAVTVPKGGTGATTLTGLVQGN